MRRFHLTLILTWSFLLISMAAQADQALLVKGRAAQKAGHHAEALKLLNEYVDLYPRSPEARYYRALALISLERRPEALEDLNQALADEPGNVKFLMLKVKTLAALGRRPEADLIFTRIIQEDPGKVEAYKERADNFEQEGRFDAAIADLNRAARLAPQDPWVFNKRGMAWFCQGDYHKAVADFTTAIHLRPDLAISYFFRGNMYRYQMMQRDRAIADYQKGCALGSTLCCNELEKLGVKPAKKSP